MGTEQSREKTITYQRLSITENYSAWAAHSRTTAWKETCRKEFSMAPVLGDGRRLDRARILRTLVSMSLSPSCADWLMLERDDAGLWKGSRLLSKMNYPQYVCHVQALGRKTVCMLICMYVCVRFIVGVCMRSYQFTSRRGTRLVALRACVGEHYPDQVTRRPVKGTGRQTGSEALPDFVPHPRSFPRVHGTHREARTLKERFEKSPLDIALWMQSFPYVSYVRPPPIY